MLGSDSSQIDARAGTTLEGKYRLVRRLGGGGMGAVYEASHVLTGRRVAVKVMRADLRIDPAMTERFFREAQASAWIGHPNIVEVLDMGVDPLDGSPYIVQEFLPGQDLRWVLDKRGVLEPREALELLAPVMSALVAAHRKGIVHRDVKPENIFLVRGPSGTIVPKLIDFGIAKVADGALESARLTRTGMAMGTPLYMSPEQAVGEHEVDAQTDVWAIGVVLFELLAGRPPFEASNYNAVLARVLSGPIPRLDAVAPNVPTALADVVATALERDPNLRYPSMARFLGVLLDLPDLDEAAAWRAALRSSCERSLEQASEPPFVNPSAGAHDESEERITTPRAVRRSGAVGGVVVIAAGSAVALAITALGLTAPRRVQAGPSGAGASVSVPTVFVAVEPTHVAPQVPAQPPTAPSTWVAAGGSAQPVPSLIGADAAAAPFALPAPAGQPTSAAGRGGSHARRPSAVAPSRTDPPVEPYWPQSTRAVAPQLVHVAPPVGPNDAPILPQ
jgi:serine/threonine-protein kinase